MANKIWHGIVWYGKRLQRVVLKLSQYTDNGHVAAPCNEAIWTRCAAPCVYVLITCCQFKQAVCFPWPFTLDFVY